MRLDDLPPEIIDLIASYIMLAEASKKSSPNGLCPHTSVPNGHHTTGSCTTTGPFPAKSSVTNLASVSRHIRDVLFTSRQSRFLKIKFDGNEFRKGVGISEELQKSVKKLRLITPPSPFASKRDDTYPGPFNKYQGIGDLLMPYNTLQHLEIDWCLLERDDPRIAAMEKSANAIPVMKFDLRCSRACTLWSVHDLHIKLGSDKVFDTAPVESRLAQQLDLITQQFDLPCLRHLHVSQDFTGGIECLDSQWTKILPSIRLQYWPQLESVSVCVTANYRTFYAEDDHWAQVPIWRPLVRKVLEHLATSKQTPKANISLLWKLSTPNISPYDNGDESRSTLREQIMPTQETFTECVRGLGIRAKRQPFTLQIFGTTSSDKQAVRLLLASYDPTVSNRDDQAGSPFYRTLEDGPRDIRFELDKKAISQLDIPVFVQTVRFPGNPEEDRRFGRFHQGHQHNRHFARIDPEEDVAGDDEDDEDEDEGFFGPGFDDLTALRRLRQTWETVTDEEVLRRWRGMGLIPDIDENGTAEELNSDTEDDEDVQEAIDNPPADTADAPAEESEDDEGNLPLYRNVAFPRGGGARARFLGYLSAFMSGAPPMMLGGEHVEVDGELAGEGVQ